MSGIRGGLSVAWNYLQPKIDIGEFVFFKLVSDYLDKKIAMLSEGIMERAMHGVALVALSLMTIWILWLGYQVATGTFRNSMTSVVTDMAKKVIIISVAISMSLLGTDLVQFFSHDMDQAINYLVTGEENTDTASAIDKNLAYTQVAFTAIDAVAVTEGNPELRDEKARALMFAGFGTTSPALTAGAMLVYFKFAIGFFIGLGPIFILLSMFQATKSMFQRWLQYGIATLFAMAGLNAVTSIVLELAAKVAAGFWGARAINGLIEANPEGLSSQAMQQGWMGLILTVALISVPTMLAAFFGGLAGGFMHYSAFGGAAAGVPGQRPGEAGYRGASSATNSPAAPHTEPVNTNIHGSRTEIQASVAQADAVKTGVTPNRERG